jgi:hypothetical protein
MHSTARRKAGFKKISDSIQRAWGIDQPAIVMDLGLEDPRSEAVQAAKRDLSLMGTGPMSLTSQQRKKYR